MKAATGEEVTAEELGGGDVHTRISGVADHLADDDATRSRSRATSSTSLPRRRPPPSTRATPEPPAYDPAELYGIVPRDPRKPYDVRELIARLVDGSRFHEFKARYGPTLVTGFAHLHGYPVGILANNGVLFSESALKATHFIELCCAARRPAPLPPEHHRLHGRQAVRARRHRQGRRQDGERGRERARAEAHGASSAPRYGAGNYGMCGRAYSPRFLFMWPNARISVMGGEQAAQTLLDREAQQLAARGKTLTDEEQREVPGADPREVRRGRQPLLLDRAPLGRRHPRSRRDARRARPRARGVAERADPGDARSASSGCSRLPRCRPTR